MRPSISQLARHAVLLVAAVALNVGTAAAQTFNAVTGFSGAANPSGVFSYGSATSLGGSLTLFSHYEPACGGTAGVECLTSGKPIPNQELVIHNTSGAPVTYLTITQPPNVLNLDPEGGFTVLRFTAPTTDTYTVSGFFQPIDNHNTTGTAAHVLVNGIDLFAAVLLTVTPQANFFLPALTLSAGSTVDFVTTSAVPGAYAYLSTGLAAQITGSGTTVTPEPASMTLLASGLIGMFAAARRRRTRTAAFR